MYSPWIWLYFLVTILLTLLVLLGTWVLWKKKEREVEEKFIKLEKREKML